MKITREDILKIKPESSLKVRLSDYRACDSARAIAYRTALADPRPDVERYKVSINTKTWELTITAIKKS
jgi:hypothetical protein